MHVILVSGPNRTHKLLVLLEGYDVTQVSTVREAFGLSHFARRRSVVMVDALGRYAPLAFLACLVSLSPLVFRVRGPIFQEEREVFHAKRGLGKWSRYLANNVFARICLRRSRLVLYNSQFTMDMLGPYDRARHTAIVHNPYTPPPGASPAPPGLPEEGLRLLTVTKMNARSKMETLCDAIEEWIPTSFWEEASATWYICGGGIHEQRLRDLVAARGLEGHIHVLGMVDYLPALYEWCDVLVHLTYLDAFPNSVMEAMMAGKPVLTNVNSAGVREQVMHDLTGMVVEEGPAVTQALRAYEEDPAMRRRHGQAGREFVEERFSVKVQAKRLREALQALDG